MGTQVVSDHSLKSGIEVEARSFVGAFLGGWHRALVLEVSSTFFQVHHVCCDTSQCKG